MFDYQIFLLGVLVSLLLAGGLFLTIVEFKDIDKNPNKYYPKSFAKNSAPDTPKTAPATAAARSYPSRVGKDGEH